MGLLNIFTKKDILKKIEKKNKIIRFIIFLFSGFIVALSYNVFFVKSNLVIGGFGGLGIVFKELFNWNTSVFMTLSTIFLLVLSYIMIGKKETKKNIVGAVTYTILVALTEPLSNIITIKFNSYLFAIIIVSIIYGIAMGLIYKVGYSTGGTDILNQILRKYAKTSIGKTNNYINIIIIFTSTFIFGIPKTIYAIFCLILINSIVDLIVLGNSDSKFCIIKTKNIKHIEEFLKKDFNIGYSLLSSSGGIDTKKRRTIMCIVTSREYYRFKNLILDIDSKAFFITYDCYEVLGGNSKRIINLD